MKEGRLVWERFHLKSLLAQSAVEDKINTLTITRMPNQASLRQIIMFFQNGEFVLDSPTQISQELSVLSIGEIAVSLPFPVRRDRVIFGSDTSLEGLYKRMLNTLKQDYPSLKWQQLLKEIIQREEEFTSLIGHGISLPHTYLKDVDETLLIIGRVEPPIPCQHTQNDISLVFMLLSPENEPVEHLNHISKIAKFVIDSEQRKALLDAHSADELFDVFSSP